jgi:hypothetical protein
METKVQIVASFHRFVVVGEGKPERRESYARGQFVTASERDAEDWIAKGLAEAITEPVKERPAFGTDTAA